jgi:hypothetical protein
MFSLNQQKHKMKLFMKERKYYLSVFGRSPSDDWKLFLMIFIFAVGLVVATAMITYNSFANIRDEASQEEITSKKVADIEKAEEIITDFDEKRDRFNQLLSE